MQELNKILCRNILVWSGISCLKETGDFLQYLADLKGFVAIKKINGAVFIPMVKYIFMYFDLDKIKIGLSLNGTSFGLGINKQPYVGWYANSSDDLHISGTAYLLGKLPKKMKFYFR